MAGEPTPTIPPEKIPLLDAEIGKPTIKPGPILEAYAKRIAQGEHAKDSFIWLTLKFSFFLGAILSICLMLVYFHFAFGRNEPDKIDIIAELKDVWSIFTPMLTLTLGYAFGKRGDNKSETGLETE